MTRHHLLLPHMLYYYTTPVLILRSLNIPVNHLFNSPSQFTNAFNLHIIYRASAAISSEYSRIFHVDTVICVPTYYYIQCKFIYIHCICTQYDFCIYLYNVSCLDEQATFGHVHIPFCLLTWKFN